MSSAVASGSTQKMQMEVNPRGIPRAPFVANVEDYVGGRDGSVDGVMKTFQETSAKYRYMELSLQQRKKALSTKIPDIEQTLSVVLFLQRRRLKALGQEPDEAEAEDEDGDEDDLESDLDGDDDAEGGADGGKEVEPLKTLFELNDTLYAEAEVEETGEVGLWLGASTMLLYPLAEAVDLLTAKLAAAKKSHEETVEDLEWLREQVTVMEVNFARVHNWDVKRRRDQKASGAALTTPVRKDEDGDGDEDDEEEAD